MERLQTHLRNAFLAGIFAAIPVAITAFIIWWVDDKTRAPVEWIFGRSIPLLGIVIALAAIYLLGLIVSSFAGKALLSLIDALINRIPLIRDVYKAWKHIVVTPGGGTEGVFSRVALIPDEMGLMLMMGFTSGKPIPGDPNTTCVFVPTAPNPVAGRLYFVPLTQCRFLDLSVEEAFKDHPLRRQLRPRPSRLRHRANLRSAGSGPRSAAGCPRCWCRYWAGVIFLSRLKTLVK